MKNRVWAFIFFLGLAGGFIFLNSNFKQDKVVKSSNENQTSVPRESAIVSKVIDGDTVEVLINNQKATVRLIGIDSPEVLDERKPIECFGKQASDKAKEILSKKTITLESDPTQGDRDEYGRLLRYIFLTNGMNFNKSMLSEGYAREYTFKNNFYTYQSEFIRAEEDAKEDNRGLWQKCWF